jgi:hypothetical protein
MPLVLKLIGQFQGRKTYEIRDSFEGPVNIKLLIELFSFWGLTIDEIDKIKFITDSEQIKNPEKSFPVKADEDRIIFVFTSDIELRNKLAGIFMKEGHEITQPGQESSQSQQSHGSNEVKQQVSSAQTVFPNPEICKPLTVKEPEPVPKLTSDLIDVMNVKSVSLFSDADFKSLISIYLRRPELFGTLAHYVQNGNVHEESLCHVKTVDELTDEELTHYKSLADKINHLELGVTNDVIINHLIKYSGHLNLTLRSILCNSAKGQ